MSWYNIVLEVFIVIGAIGLFLFGMKLMSEGLQKIAGNKMRNVLSKMTSNPFKGILTGALITTTIQSSTATTIMVVSFVNAGLLTLTGAIGVIMGANIGTTATAWIISLLGFNFSISTFAIPLIAVALPFMFVKQSKYKSIGEFILGFALLFLALDYLKNAVPDISQYPKMLESVASLSSYGYFSIILFVIAGSILTIVVQSSSAMMAVTLMMFASGWIPFEIAVAMVLGENIGTTLTANIAAMTANQAAKKAARAHLIFNVLGVVWALVLFYPFLSIIDKVVYNMQGMHPSDNTVYLEGTPEYATIQGAKAISLSIFHSSFNILNSFFLVWFTPLIEKIVNKVVKTPDSEKGDEFRLRYIPARFVNTSELDLELAKKEIVIFSERIIRMYDFLIQLDKLDNNQFEKLMERIKKYEEISDRMEIEIANYLTKVSEGGLSDDSSKQVSMMLKIVDNLESIGDSIYQLALFKQSERKQKLNFPEKLHQNIAEMHVLVANALNNMLKNLGEDYSLVDAKLGYEFEQEINKKRDILREMHFESVKKNEYSYEAGIVYSAIYALYEKTGDFVINVIEALDNTERNAAHIPAKPHDSIEEGDI
ncbi:Na/Pi cotransporter family protein [Bacteroidales bacterium OttesenSCG-928-C19]|nr:Na/Pi cotransporter family protein [Bacteroidales bacterium OttesenSCG-928-C19]